jgi:poly(3-hydroxybutyrate) depolymerase
MLYHWYELGHAAVRPVRAAAGSARLLLSNPFNPLTHTSVARHTAAALEVFERTTRRYDKPNYRVDRTTVDGTSVGVREEVVWEHPFCRLVHFKRNIPAARAARDPRLLLVAPMSGHFATLLRGTVETFLPDHEVYITDWQDARDVPLSAGDFHLADYIDAMIDMFRHFGGDVHVFAVCQPAVPVLAAVSLLEAEGDPSVPLSMSLAGGPIDTRRSPTIVNQLAEQRGTDWFRRNVITPVPWPNPGFGRSVYPGFLQLSGFMTMNLDRHMNAHKDLFFHLVRGDGDSAEKHREFYDEYLAVMDLTAEFYLDTVDTVFVRHLLPRGLMRHRGRAVDPSAIRRVGLLTIEGEKDDITGLGQCQAAHDLCSSIPAADKMHFTCPHVGHYGIFNGSRFRREIAPRIAAFARERDPRTKAGIAAPAIQRRTAEEKIDPQRREISSSAFTFGTHSSTHDVPTSERREVAATTARASHTLAADAMYLPQLAQLTIWQLAGSLMLDGLRAWHPAPTSAARLSPEHR